jgi:glutamine amidotransferase
LVDYGSGNLRSVSKALEAAGAGVTLCRDADALDGLDAVIVPGVGAFGDCARNLRETGLWEPIRAWLADGRPYLGICLGYQLLFESSAESPGVAGLGAFAGRVERFPDAGPKVPHMGWNTLEAPTGPLFAGLGDAPSFYFVHSFFPVPSDPTLVSARCDYGEPFAAAISRGPVHAVQFHPEKSQSAGLALLRNFLATLTPALPHPHAPASCH